MDYVSESSRNCRMRNIATAYQEINKEHDVNGVGTERLRLYIRKQLCLESLNGEARLGDLRAHGDAVGGHGLHLEVIRTKVNGKQVRVIPFNEENASKCQDFFENNSTGGTDYLV